MRRAAGGAFRPFDSTLSLLEAYYGASQVGELHGALHARLAAAAAGALKKTRGRLFAFRNQLDDAQKADAVQREADMITANMYRIKPGMAQVGGWGGACWFDLLVT